MDSQPIAVIPRIHSSRVNTHIVAHRICHEMISMIASVGSTPRSSQNVITPVTWMVSSSASLYLLKSALILASSTSCERQAGASVGRATRRRNADSFFLAQFSYRAVVDARVEEDVSGRIELPAALSKQLNRLRLAASKKKAVHGRHNKRASRAQQAAATSASMDTCSP